MRLLTLAVPVLGRPQRVKEVLKAWTDSRLEVLFLPDRSDAETIAAIDEFGAAYSFAPPAPAFGVPTYASKINHAYRITDLPFLLWGADDIAPATSKWLDRAMLAFDDPNVGLVALQDGHHLVTKGLLATHGIIRRSYVEAHGTASLPDAGPVMHEGYRHWCCDCEISAVARLRGAFRHVPRSKLLHERHRREDATYQLGRSFADVDKALLAERLPTWPRL